MNRVAPAIVLVAFTAVLAVLALLPQKAEASPGALGLLLAESAPAAIYSEAESFTIACDSDSQAISWTSSKAQMALTCWVNGTTPAFVGQVGVLSTTSGIPVCEDAACAAGGSGIVEFPLAKKGTYGCDTTGASVDLVCLGSAP